MYTFSTVVFLFFVQAANSLRQIVRRAGLTPFREKMLFAMLLSKIQMFNLIHLTYLAVQNAAKQPRTIHHPQNPLATTPDL